MILCSGVLLQWRSPKYILIIFTYMKGWDILVANLIENAAWDLTKRAKI